MKLKSVLNAVLLVLVLLLYSRTVGYDFTHFDDDSIILAQRSTLTHAPNFERIFTTDAFGGESNPYYRPLQTLSFNLFSWISGEISPTSMHLVQLLLFIGVVLGLFSALLQMGICTHWAFLLSCIYLAHPLFVSSVSWLPARGDLLMSLAGIWSFYFFVRFCSSRRLWHLSLCALIYTFALFSKETAAFLPFAFLLYYILLSPIKKLSVKEGLMMFIVFIVTCAWFILRQVTLPNPIGSLKSGEWITQLQTLPNMLSQSFFPFDNSPLPQFELWKTLLGLLIIGLWIFGYFRISSGKRSLYAFGFIWYVVFLVPTFFTRVDGFDYLEHRSLFPMMGWIISLGSFLDLSIPKQKFLRGHPVVWSFSFFFLLCCVLSVSKAGTYRNQKSYAVKATERNPNGLSYSLLGTYYQQQGNSEEAYRCFSTAIQHTPSFLVYAKRAQIRTQRGDYAGAIDDYNHALNYQDNVYVYFSRALVKQSIGDVAGAKRDVEYFLSKNPHDYHAQALLHELQ